MKTDDLAAIPGGHDRDRAKASRLLGPADRLMDVAPTRELDLAPARRGHYGERDTSGLDPA